MQHGKRLGRLLAQLRDQQVVRPRRISARREHGTLVVAVETVGEQEVGDVVAVHDDEAFERVVARVACERLRTRVRGEGSAL